MPLSQRALQFTISRAKCPLPGWTIVNASPSRSATAALTLRHARIPGSGFARRAQGNTLEAAIYRVAGSDYGASKIREHLTELKSRRDAVLQFEAQSLL